MPRVFSSAALLQHRAAYISKHVLRVKQTDDFGPIRAPGNNEFWRPATAKLPQNPDTEIPSYLYQSDLPVPSSTETVTSSTGKSILGPGVTPFSVKLVTYR